MYWRWVKLVGDEETVEIWELLISHSLVNYT